MIMCTGCLTASTRTGVRWRKKPPGGPGGLAGAREIKPYVGPFPPSGTHDYELTIYALDTQQLDLRGNAGLEEFTRAAEAHNLATATLVGKFTKSG